MKHLALIFIAILLLATSCGKNTDTPVNPTSNQWAEITLLMTPGVAGNCARFSPDGNSIVVSLDEYWVHDPQANAGKVVIYNLVANKIAGEHYLSQNGNIDEFSHCAFSPKGTRIAASGNCYNGWFGNGIVIWNTSSNGSDYVESKNDFGEGSVTQFEYTSSGDSIIVNTTKGIYLWDVYHDKITLLKTDGFSVDKNFSVSRDSRYLLAESYPKLLDMSQTPPVSSEITAIGGALTPDSKFVITTRQNLVSLFDIAQNKKTLTYTESSMKYHYLVAVSKNGKYFATSYDVGEDQYSITECGIQIWDREAMAPIGKVPTNFEPVYLEFGSTENQLLATSQSGVYIYKISYSKK